MRIDAHVHLWELGSDHNIWIARKIFGLQRDFTPDMLQPLLRHAGIDGVVLVQAAAAENETAYMLKLAQEFPFVKGVIGWVDLELDAEQLGIEIRKLKAIPKFRGIRAHPRREFDPLWLTDERVKNGYRMMAAAGIPVDFLVNCTQLDLARDVLADVPEVVSIINHCGRPFVMTGDTVTWRRAMRRIADDTKALVKLSGLVERAGVEWRTETLRPWVEALIEDFGCERLIFASNWPVMTLMSTYQGWWDSLNEIVRTVGVSDAQAEQLFGGNAVRAYGL